VGSSLERLVRELHSDRVRRTEEIFGAAEEFDCGTFGDLVLFASNRKRRSIGRRTFPKHSRFFRSKSLDLICVVPRVASSGLTNVRDAEDSAGAETQANSSLASALEFKVFWTAHRLLP
jgi:hypothetical protein